MMARKANKDNWLTVKIFQKTNNMIALRIESKQLDAKITGIEHTDQYHGNDIARTHNNLFNTLKEILVLQGRWKNIIPTLGRKKKVIKSEESDIDNEYGFIYVTTNLINGKKYIGKHTTFGDDYLGSGTILKKAIGKYGKENFVRKDIAFAYDHEQLCDLEKYYIDKFKAVTDPNFYNCLPGGTDVYKEAQ